MKAKELRTKTDEELANEERRLFDDLFRARFEHFTQQLEDHSRLRRLRRELARVKTVRRERARTGQKAGA